MTDHAPRCDCCRERARILAERARYRIAGNHARRAPCTVCGSTEQRNRRRMVGGVYLRFCPEHY